MSNPTGRISKDFTWEEFYCHGSRKGGVHEGVECGIPMLAQIQIRSLVRDVLQPLRSALGVEIKIVSGYRCKAHNTRCGGARDSQHMLGNAADIQVVGIAPWCIYWILDPHMKNVNKHGPGGLGKYRSFTHVDIRPTNRAVRW